jgi:kynureninase
MDIKLLDKNDPLLPFRKRFKLKKGVNYLDGNSLGALPRGVTKHVQSVMKKEWGVGLIRSWNEAGWYDAPVRIGAKLAPLLGAKPHEVIVCDTISLNLYKLLVMAARLRPERKVILAEKGNFPSDTYIVESVARLLNMQVRYEGEIDETVAVHTLSHINYKSALKQDMALVTRAAHEKGSLIIWDLAHSSGAVDLKLDACHVNFAVGCGYKFLNGGPGAPSHIYVAEQHLNAIDQPLSGWFGHKNPFAFDESFEAVSDIRAILTSTPQYLSLASFEKALEVYDGVSMQAVERKGQALGDVMIALYDEHLSAFGVGLETTRESIHRGNHVSFTHEHGYKIVQMLIKQGIIGDFRAPNIMRFGFNPLYVRFKDIYDCVMAIKKCLDTKSYNEMTMQGIVT